MALPKKLWWPTKTQGHILAESHFCSLFNSYFSLVVSNALARISSLKDSHFLQNKIDDKSFSKMFICKILWCIQTNFPGTVAVSPESHWSVHYLQDPIGWKNYCYLTSCSFLKRWHVRFAKEHYKGWYFWVCIATTFVTLPLYHNY